MPYYFTRSGAIIGAVAGAITIAVLTRKSLRARIVSLYKKEVIEPKDIARIIGRSERQIQRVINKLAKKGEIVCQKTHLSERICACEANTY
jgi:DNA-binding transcriptional regulator LsrR (DeoR family)